MSLLYVTVFLLLIFGTFTLFDLRISDVLDEITHADKKKKTEVGDKSGQKKKKRFSLQTHKQEITASLQETASKLSWEGYLRIVAGSAMLGFALGSSVDNMLLALLLLPCCAIIPSIVIQIRGRNYRKNLQRQMEQALAVITNNYCTVNNVYHAVADVIPTTDMPMKAILTAFCAQIDTNDSIENALNTMRGKIDDVHWRRWIDRMLKCQSNSSLRQTLKQIPQEMSDQRQLQMELDTEMRQIWVKHLTVAALALICIPFVGMLDPSWGEILKTNIFGKIAVAFDVFLVMVSTVYAYKINKPLYLSSEGSEKK